MIGKTGLHTQARTVLVVAGNAHTQTMILEYTKAKGHSVIVASTPALGLSTFNMTQPDIVMTDLFLPGQDGLMLVKHIRERRPTCPVVLLSGAGHGESTMEGLRVGALGYVQQPIQEDAFAQALQRAIHALPAAVDDEPGVEPAWRLLHVYGDALVSFLRERETIGRIGSARKIC